MKECSCESNCKCNTIIHSDLVEKIDKKMLNDEIIIDMADFFKIFADSTRLKIINILMENSMCVCDIAALANMSHSAISHQLRMLKQYKIVKYKKVGKIVYYELDDNHINRIFSEGCEHIIE